MRNGFTIHVVIPALNEEESLPAVIARIPQWADRIIVADNGSSDRTAAVASAAGATVVREAVPGYGRACLAGIAASERLGSPDVLVFLDADGSDVPEQMDRLVDPILSGQADLVIGSRMRGHMARGAMTLPQRVGNLLAPALIRHFWRQPYSDLGPFRAIRSASLRRLAMDDQTYGWTVQMQIRAARTGIKAVEVAVDYGRRRGGASKISGTVRGVVKAGSTILGCVAQERLWPRPLPDRNPPAVGLLAKFPEPGRAKTRLIPALAPAGAAHLHDRMVRHALSMLSRFGQGRDVDCRVFSTGVDPDTFARHFSTSFPCTPQVDGDLGRRIDHILRELLRKSPMAVVMGTDSPDVSPELLQTAFASLETADVVLGPARDGGYYLIGLKRPAPSLFERIEWSTAGVAAATLSRAASLGLRVKLLPTLSDIDEPADLAVWDRVLAAHQPSGPTPTLSIIIPTLNEAPRIGRLVDELRRPGVEIIVVDGGSCDDTIDRAAASGARVLVGSPGRGPQLNAGAAIARGGSLLFLHADSTLPQDFHEHVKATLADPATAMGAFRFKLDRASVSLRAVEYAVRLRCRLFATPYGDQAFFMRRETFARLGGFASIPLMEDIELVRRARELGSVRVVSQEAITSARRWTSVGVAGMTLINQACIIAFTLGVSPHRLARWRHRLTAPRSRESRASRQPSANDNCDQIMPVGSFAPNAARAECIASSDLEVRK